MNKKRVLHALIIVYTVMYGICSVADQITVYNKTDQNLFVRIYYYQGPAKNIIASDKEGKVLNIVEIPANSSKKVERPARWKYQLFPVPRYYDRQLVIATDFRMLKKILNECEYRVLPWVNIGTLHGSSFYLAQNGQLAGYNMANWKVVRTVIELAKKIETKIETKIRDMINQLVRCVTTGVKPR